MLAYFEQSREGMRTYLRRETAPSEPASRRMSISMEFFEILQLSFKERYLSKVGELSSQKSRIEAINVRMDKLFNCITNFSTNPKFDDIVALAAAYHNIALKCAKSTEISELDIAKTHLEKSRKLLRKNSLNPKAILTSISVLYELDSVCQKMKMEQDSKYLNEALSLCVRYLDPTTNLHEPIHIPSIIGYTEEDSNPIIVLETLYYRTLHDLGIQYLAKPKDKHEFAPYIHHLLNALLKYVVSEGICDEVFEEKDIALTLIDLSKYFLANDRFTEAQKHITAADYVIQKFFPNKFPTEKDERNETQLNPSCENGYIHAISDSSWGSYGVHLLRFWMGKFLENKENTSNEIQKPMSESEIKSNDSKLLIFSGFEKELECMVHHITETRILKPVDAKSVFLNTLRHLDRAKEYFSTDTDIESYAKIVLEISNAYKYLAGYEEERSKRIKLHKLRVKCLENVCKKVQESNTTIVDTELQIYKRISSETVISCSTVMDLMFEETDNDKSFKDTLIKNAQYVKLIKKYIIFYSRIS